MDKALSFFPFIYYSLFLLLIASSLFLKRKIFFLLIIYSFLIKTKKIEIFLFITMNYN